MKKKEPNGTVLAAYHVDERLERRGQEKSDGQRAGPARHIGDPVRRHQRQQAASDADVEEISPFVAHQVDLGTGNNPNYQ